jgi:hypothetical protein
MIDYKIIDGDIAVDSAGRFIRLTDREAEFQRALICITARLGAFVYDRELGSRRENIEANSADADRCLELVLNEALSRFEDTYVSVLDYGSTLTVKISIDGDSRVEEVQLYGNV